MSTSVKLLKYSGRSNPVWSLKHDHEKKLASILKQLETPSVPVHPGRVPRLGYRGIVFRSDGKNELPKFAHVYDGVVQVKTGNVSRFYLDNNAELEKFLFSTATDVVTDVAKQRVKEKIAKNLKAGPGNTMLKHTRLTAPPYDPGKWNDDECTTCCNNCYNYANDIITDTFAQPGRGSDNEFNEYTCDNISNAARHDGMTDPEDPVDPTGNPPNVGQYVALVIDPTDGDKDFHWYRQDSDGEWSHKPGQTDATYLDDSGNTITDPETCDRGDYTTWCGYLYCNPEHMTIL